MCFGDEQGCHFSILAESASWFLPGGFRNGVQLLSIVTRIYEARVKDVCRLGGMVRGIRKDQAPTA